MGVLRQAVSITHSSDGRVYILYKTALAISGVQQDIENFVGNIRKLLPISVHNRELNLQRLALSSDSFLMFLCAYKELAFFPCFSVAKKKKNVII